MRTAVKSADGRPRKAEQSAEAVRASFFVRSDALRSRLLALVFVAGCLACLALAALYRWPEVNLVTCSLAPLPPFAAFGVLLPVIALGGFGVRRGWLLVGLILWCVGLFVTEEAVQALRPFPGRARERFITARMAYRSYLADSSVDSGAVPVPLRVVSWNVQGARGLDAVGLARLASLQPDIVLLQECRMSTLKRGLQESGVLRDYHMDGGRQVLLSRFRCERQDDVPLRAWRGSVWRVQPSPGRYVHCINVHLARNVLHPSFVRYWRPERVREAIADTARRLEELRRTIEVCREKGPVIVAGDFNLPPHYPGIRQATGGLVDCFAEGGYGWGKTIPAGLPLYRVDMIFAPREAEVYYAAAVRASASDHRMTVAEVEVPLNATHGREEAIVHSPPAGVAAVRAEASTAQTLAQ